MIFSRARLLHGALWQMAVLFEASPLLIMNSEPECMQMWFQSTGLHQQRGLLPPQKPSHLQKQWAFCLYADFVAIVNAVQAHCAVKSQSSTQQQCFVECIDGGKKMTSRLISARTRQKERLLRLNKPSQISQACRAFQSSRFTSLALLHLMRECIFWLSPEQERIVTMVQLISDIRLKGASQQFSLCQASENNPDEVFRVISAQRLKPRLKIYNTNCVTTWRCKAGTRHQFMKPEVVPVEAWDTEPLQWNPRLMKFLQG